VTRVQRPIWNASRCADSEVALFRVQAASQVLAVTRQNQLRTTLSMTRRSLAQSYVRSMSCVAQLSFSTEMEGRKSDFRCHECLMMV